MGKHKTGTREEWLAARVKLLEAEKDLTKRGDELALQRQQLPWVKVEKAYSFDTENGCESLVDLFRGRSQLMVYHFMFGPDFKAGCPTCSSIADGFNGVTVHMAHHDLMFWAISRAPLEKLLAYERRMGWTFPWASAAHTDFNSDYAVSFTEEEQQKDVEYNFKCEPQYSPEAVAQSGSLQWRQGEKAGEGVEQILATMSGVDVPAYHRERPGLSAFTLEDGVVYHTYSAYARGVDAVWGMYPWFDCAPKGRNEHGVWWKRHDEYEKNS
jgi:predicted dithiol-disulfide oxidoreductase (DUF899 family)